MVIRTTFENDSVGAYDLISDILENNPNLVTPDEEGKTPIDLAKEVPDSFGFMNAVLEKYQSKINKEKAKTLKPFNYTSLFKTNSSDKKPLKNDKEHNSAQNLNKCCWNCDAINVKLYKCTGCKKAYYCSKKCIEHDWSVHGGYCLKKQQKKQKKN